MGRLVYGHGVNDLTDAVTMNRKPKQFYAAWTNMLKRCYSTKYHAENPTYIGCTVCDEWLSLAKFKEWYDANHIDGWHLDKDLLNTGGKVYCPANCRYIPQDLNKLLTDHGAKRGLYPQGVYFHKPSGKFLAQINIDGKNNYLGLFCTHEQAEQAYKVAKSAEILRKIELYTGIVDQGVLDSLTKIANNSIK